MSEGVDIRVQDCGSICLLRPMTDEGKSWLVDNVDPDAQKWGDAIVCEPRFVENIVAGMIEEGLQVMA